MLKKVFWISLGFFLLTLIFLGVYNFAFKHNPSNPIADPKKYAEAQKKNEEKTSTHSVAFEPFTNESISFPIIFEDSLLYYSMGDNSIKQVPLDKSHDPTVIANGFPGELKRLLWAPRVNGVEALIQNNGNQLWYYINLRDHTSQPLKKEMSRLSWNTLGDGIYYLYTDPATGNRSLNKSTFTGEQWSKLTDLPPGDYFVSTIPQSSQVAFWTRPDGLFESRLESISITGEGRKTLLAGQFGGDYLWSPNNQFILVGSTGGRASNLPRLGIMTGDGSNYRDLLIPTLVSKIAWSNDNQTIYYALPGAFPSGSVLPNDYYGKPIYTKDTFWKMNLKTGKRERLVPLNEMDQGFDATNLFLGPDETKLFFIDRPTNKLYSINL